MIGRVVSNKMEKTATILVESKKTHPLYKKSYLWSKKYLADDLIGVQLGDVVEIEKVKPVSKRKHWQIKKVLGRDIVALATEELKEEAAEAIAEVLPEEKEEKIASAESSSEPKEKTAKNKKIDNEKKSRAGQSGNMIKSRQGGRAGSPK